MKRISLDSPSLFFNRHLSWMQFNRRVLEEAFDAKNPLLERVKFLAHHGQQPGRICGSARGRAAAAGRAGPRRSRAPTGLPPGEVLAQLSADIHEFVDGPIRLLAREAGSRAGATNPSACAALRQLEAGGAQNRRAFLSRNGSNRC